MKTPIVAVILVCLSAVGATGCATAPTIIACEPTSKTCAGLFPLEGAKSLLTTIEKSS